MMRDHLDLLNKRVTQAAKEAGLPEPFGPGFDGDAWIWIWRDTVSTSVEHRNTETAREVHLAARPDPILDVFATELSALLWIPEQRSRSWARATAVLSPSFEELADPGSEFTKQLSTRLQEAFAQAKDAAQRLDELDSRRQDTMRKLRDQGLLH